MIPMKLVFILYYVTVYAESANILYIIPFSGKSHYIALNPIGVELAKRGHNVTVISAIRMNDPPPNYHQIIADDKSIWEMLGIEKPNIFSMIEMSAAEFQNKVLWNGGLAITEVALNSTAVKEFLKEDNKFDLVISEQFYQEALNVLAFKYKAPLVLVSTVGNIMKHNLLVGNPLQLATAVCEHLVVRDPRSFYGRLQNVYHVFYDYIGWKYFYLEKQEQLVKKYLPDIFGVAPSLYDIQKDAALLLINSHFSYDTPLAYLPNVVEIGGIHLTKAGVLPEDLQKILDSSKNGIVYVNFGSNVRSSELPVEKKNSFLKVFKGLKQTVLWKWEDNNLENKPNNVYVQKWFPQREILAHPNIKLFVSHGGLIGTQEAIYNGVPVVGVPIYGDQLNNILLLEEAGCGRLLEYNSINENTLKSTIKSVINDVSYMKNAKELSQRFKDRPMSPLDTAVFWLEYVIRNKGAGFMKSPARNLTWFSYNMIDIYVFIAMVILTIVFFIVRAACMVKNSFIKPKQKIS